MQFQELGHQAILVIGTSRADRDPTGQSETRRQLTEEQILANALTYQKQIFKIIDPAHHGGIQLVVAGSADVPDIINLASKVTVARMLERDDFETRYREGSP